MLTELFRSLQEYETAIDYLNDARRDFIGFAAKSCGRLSLLVYPCEQVAAALETREFEKLGEALTVDGGFIKATAVQAMAFRHAFGAPVMEIPTRYAKYSDLVLDANKPGRVWEVEVVTSSKQLGQQVQVYDISGLKKAGGDIVIVINGKKYKIEVKGHKGRLGF